MRTVDEKLDQILAELAVLREALSAQQVSTRRRAVVVADVLTLREVAERFGLKHSAAHRREKMGAFKHLLITRPIGARRYSRTLVERFLAGESTVQLGGRRR